MATQLKLRRGTTTQHSTFTGASGEVTVDTDKKTLAVHDGSTAGGTPLMKESGTSSTGVVSFGGTHFYKDASGNVGIGTTSPRAPLSFAATVDTAGNPTKIRLYDDGASNYYGFGISTGSLDITAGTGGAVNFWTSSGGTKTATIDSSGNVLIGSSSASGLATANRGLVEVNGSTDAAVSVKSNNTVITYMYGSATEGRIATNTAVPLTFFTNATERFRVGTSGQFGIGGANYGTSGQVLTSQGSGAAPVWATPPSAAAWVCFNGITAGIRASYNVSSISRTAAGMYTVNFASALPDANYAVANCAPMYSSSNATSTFSLQNPGTSTVGQSNKGTGGFGVTYRNNTVTSTAYDPSDFNCIVFR